MNIKYDDKSKNISVSGRWNLETADDIVMDIKDKIDKFDLEVINLDFSNLEYIDSLGISTLIMLNKDLDKENKKLSILKPPEIIQKVLKLVRIDLMIPVIK